jgi:hypothetical protein
MGRLCQWQQKLCSQWTLPAHISDGVTPDYDGNGNLSSDGTWTYV